MRLPEMISIQPVVDPDWPSIGTESMDIILRNLLFESEIAIACDESRLFYLGGGVKFHC